MCYSFQDHHAARDVLNLRVGVPLMTPGLGTIFSTMGGQNLVDSERNGQAFRKSLTTRG